MDAGDSRRIEREQVDLPNGHWIKDNIFGPVIPSSVGNPTIYFERTFDFNCVVTPTSWLFRVTFTRAKGKDVSCISAIRRTDHAPGLVNVQFWTTILTDIFCFDVSYVQHFISGMPAGRVDRQVFKHIISSKYASILYEQKLHVQFFLIVHGCHSAGDKTE
ncbi:hypothetical protein AVEN_205602-1 [Araneus ventricosus]|uniref:Uncharacterized protein n=1 Tax=Araneus ventricosus TaxID=182803 RepID=A0A4Y2F9M3_ARAVE|nr:hypothetical protein AVEN_205602-1 [Araneus ventricosus]